VSVLEVGCWVGSYVTLHWLAPCLTQLCVVVPVVDNLPAVAREKHEKLSAVIRKVFGQVGDIRDNGLWMPIDEETGMSQGFAFIEFKSAQVPCRWPIPIINLGYQGCL
jgi:hypothetical protein